MAQSAAPNRVYQDFEPFFEWNEDETSATLAIMLPGFIKNQLRVQVTSTGVLRINGERPVVENISRRFAKEFPIPSYCDSNEVSAKFERGMLSVKFPKLITPAKPQQEEATTTKPPPQEEAQLPQQQGRTQHPDQAPPHVVDQKEQISDEKKKNQTEEAVAPHNVAEKKERTNVVSETGQVKSSTPEAKSLAKMTQRLKTRLLDFKSCDDEDGNTGLKRRKILMNIVVAILLVMVLGVYVKNALFRSYSSSQEEPKFQEF